MLAFPDLQPCQSNKSQASKGALVRTAKRTLAGDAEAAPSERLQFRDYFEVVSRELDFFPLREYSEGFCGGG